MSSAIQRTVCASISVAAGDSVQAPQFGLTAAASRSAEHADRRGRRRDVAQEARVPVEQRMVEQQPRGLVQQRSGRAAVLGQRTVERERGADARRRRARRRHRAGGNPASSSASWSTSACPARGTWPGPSPAARRGCRRSKRERRAWASSSRTPRGGWRPGKSGGRERGARASRRRDFTSGPKRSPERSSPLHWTRMRGSAVLGCRRRIVSGHTPRGWATVPRARGRGSDGSGDPFREDPWTRALAVLD